MELAVVIVVCVISLPLVQPLAAFPGAAGEGGAQLRAAGAIPWVVA